MSNDMATVVHRIAAETMPGTDKEKIAVRLASFVFGTHVDCLQKAVDEERRAAS